MARENAMDRLLAAATIKGYVTIRWYGTSNGYYSESVSFHQRCPIHGIPWYDPCSCGVPARSFDY